MRWDTRTSTHFHDLTIPKASARWTAPPVLPNLSPKNRLFPFDSSFEGCVFMDGCIRACGTPLQPSHWNQMSTLHLIEPPMLDPQLGYKSDSAAAHDVKPKKDLFRNLKLDATTVQIPCWMGVDSRKVKESNSSMTRMISGTSQQSVTVSLCQTGRPWSCDVRTVSALEYI
jgi:hypothetical protein